MEEKIVLTVADLAKRWRCSESYIRNMVSSGKLKTMPELPGVRFLVRYIEELENLGMDFDNLSPFEEEDWKKNVTIGKIERKSLKRSLKK